MQDDAGGLFALDERLRSEGERLLAESGIGAILQQAGYAPVGSQLMRTMTWRDLDFERPESAPDWDLHWEIGTRLAHTGWCIRLNCVDVYRQQTADAGLYWGLRVADPSRSEPTPMDDPTVWKLDLWSIAPDDFQRNRARCEQWMSLMTDEKRADILAIKEAVCHGPEYRRTMLSVHIYEAVLEHHISGLDRFRRWCEQNRRQ